MANTTDTYWSVDGQSLNTYAKNIKTMGEGRMAAPRLRGKNRIIPFREGEQWVPKLAGSREITLKIWMKGTDDDGVGLSKAKYQENWNALATLLFTPGRQFTLTKRFWAGGIIRSASALGEYAGGLDPDMIGSMASEFEIDISIPGIWFFDDVATTLSLVNGDNTVTVPGSHETTEVYFTINGARNVTTLINKAYTPQYTLTHLANLSSGDQTVIDVRKYRATTDPAAGPLYNSKVQVLHSGGFEWFKLKPGTQLVNLASTSGSGTVQIQARGAWW